MSYTNEKWELALKDNVFDIVYFFSSNGKNPRESCLDALKYIKENPELFTKKIT